MIIIYDCKLHQQYEIVITYMRSPHRVSLTLNLLLSNIFKLAVVTPNWRRLMCDHLRQFVRVDAAFSAATKKQQLFSHIKPYSPRINGRLRGMKEKRPEERKEKVPPLVTPLLTLAVKYSVSHSNMWPFTHDELNEMSFGEA